jgi:macrolide-specific efflux system membrane fusion protein
MRKILGIFNWFMQASLIKKLLIAAIIVGLGWFTIPKALGQDAKQPEYQTATAEKGTIISTVNESGNVTSNSQAGVGSPTTGVITEIYVQNGDSVTQGQNLFKVKSTATAQEIASAYASYLSAQNSLNAAQAKINSLQAALFVANQKFVTDRGITSPSDQQKADPVYIEQNATWLQAEADYKNQQGVISQAQASLTNASLSYQATQDSIVKAPIDGSVANISVKAGDQVTASGGNLSSNQSSTTSTSTNAILYIGNYSTPYVKVQANEVDITKIKPGQKATITLSAFSGKTFVGTVDQLDTSGAISSGIVTYNVYVTFAAPPSDIRPGMSASVTIQTARSDDVVYIPTAAVQTLTGESTVRVMKNGKITSVPVETGLSSDTDIEVTSGISEGDIVVTGTRSTGAATGGSAAASPFGRSLGGFGGGGGGGVVRVGGGGRGGN